MAMGCSAPCWPTLMLINVLVPVEVLHVIRTYATSRHGISIRELKLQLDYLSLSDLR